VRNVAEEVGFVISVNAFNNNNLASCKLQMLPRMLPKKRPDLKGDKPGLGESQTGRRVVTWRGNSIQTFFALFALSLFAGRAL